jgi:chaperonin GroES
LGLQLKSGGKFHPKLNTACGEGARKDSGELIPMAVKANDVVLFGKWSGTEVTVEGEELLIMKESDVLGIIS